MRFLITVAFLLASLQADAQESNSHRFDGMSAIDIMVAAASHQKDDASGDDKSQLADSPSATASVSFLGFNFVELMGRFEHQGWYPIPGQPLPGTATGMAHLEGTWQSLQFRLTSEAGVMVGPIELELLAGGIFVGDFAVPEQPFKVAVSGLDDTGQPFDLTWPEVFRPRSLELRFESPFGIYEPGPVSLPLTVINHGLADTFQLTADDDMGLGVSIIDAELTLDQGQEDSTSVELVVPAISVGLLDITITSTATSNNNAEKNNSASTVVRTQRFNLLLDSGFEAQQASE